MPFDDDFIMGYASRHAPNIYQNMLYQKRAQQEKEDVARFQATLPDIIKPLQDSPMGQDPNVAAILKSQMGMGQSGYIPAIEELVKMLGNSQDRLYTRTAPTNNMKDINYTADENVNPDLQTMMRQKLMSNRPHDVEEQAIKRMNAETMAKYRKGQVSGINARNAGKIMPNGLPYPKVKPGEEYDPDTNSVTALPGSDIERIQLDKHSDDASKVATINNVAKNMIDTGTSLLNDKDFDSLFGEGDAFTGLAARGTQYLAPGAMNKLEQFKNQLKTQGGALYKEVANSPGSMQVAEWPILEGQLATISPSMGKEDARNIISKAVDFVKNASKIKRELYALEYADKRWYNPDISGESSTHLPQELNDAFVERKGLYRYSSDGGMRKSIIDGSLSVNQNGKWEDATVQQDDRGGFSVGVAPPKAAPNELDELRRKHYE
jgi:hypothetical protein